MSVRVKKIPFIAIIFFFASTCFYITQKLAMKPIYLKTCIKKDIDFTRPFNYAIEHMMQYVSTAVLFRFRTFFATNSKCIIIPVSKRS